MTKAKNRRSKVKGAVLLMVLAVMVVLVIMLAGAMTIVSTASSRANTQYQESQAYYTARSGIEVFTQTLMTDSKYKSDNSGNLSVAGDTDKSQALELEEAIAGIFTTNAGKPVYDVKNALYAWDSINNPKANNPTVSDAIINKSYMIFDVSDIEWNDGESGPMSDGAGSTQVKIQLLKLVFDDGSTNGIDRNSISGQYTPDLSGGNSATYYIKELWLLMECTSTYNGVSSTVSKVINPIEKQKEKNPGFTSVGSSGLNNNVDVLGGNVTGGNFNWGNNGVAVGSIFVNGNVNINAQKVIALTTGESFVVNGDFTASNTFDLIANKAAGGDSKDDPFMFVNGIINVDSNTSFNTSNTSKDFKVITQAYKTGNDLKTLKGNLYVDDYLYGSANALQNLNATKSIVDGDLFICDNSTVDYLYVQNNGQWTSGPNSVQKTFLGGVVNYSSNASTKKIDFTANTGSNFWNNTLKNGVFDALCTGTVYYYYEETVNAGVTEYSGCIELHAIKELLKAHYSSNAGMLATIEAKFVETDDVNLKYLIQMDKSNFMDNMAVTASSVSMTETPTYLMKISLPKNATARMSASEMLSLPTLFSKYKQYFNLNTTTFEFVDHSGSQFNDSDSTVITDLTYTDHTQDPPQVVTKDWKNQLQSVYTALNSSPVDYNEQFIKVWDLMCALYNPTSGNMNVYFHTPAQQAALDGVSTFGGKFDVATTNATYKTFSDLTAYTNDANYLEVDTTGGNVVLILSPTNTGESCYGGGNNPGSKKGIVVKGSGYLYILLPKTGVNSDVYAFKDYKIITEDYYNDCLNADPVAVKTALATEPLIATPNIMWYADDGVEINYYNGGKTTLMGYLYGPGSSFYVGAGLGGAKTINYCGMTPSKKILPSFLGSAFVKDIAGQNDFGLVYIPPDPTKKPQEAKFNWQVGVVGYSYNGIKTAKVT